MIANLMERLVLDVVTQAIDSRSGAISYESDFSDLGLDQLDITYIVLELEVRLGIELPAELEDAQTISQMAASLRQALQTSAARNSGFRGGGSVLAATGRGLPLGRQSRRRQAFSPSQRARRHGESTQDSFAEAVPGRALKAAEPNNNAYSEHT